MDAARGARARLGSAWRSSARPSAHRRPPRAWPRWRTTTLPPSRTRAPTTVTTSLSSTWAAPRTVRTAPCCCAWSKSPGLDGCTCPSRACAAGTAAAVNRALKLWPLAARVGEPQGSTCVAPLRAHLRPCRARAGGVRVEEAAEEPRRWRRRRARAQAQDARDAGGGAPRPAHVRGAAGGGGGGVAGAGRPAAAGIPRRRRGPAGVKNNSC